MILTGMAQLIALNIFLLYIGYDFFFITDPIGWVPLTFKM